MKYYFLSIKLKYLKYKHNIVIKNDLENFINKKIMVFGTFDILYEGHISILEQVKMTGDYLLVVFAREKTVKEVKK